VSFTPMIRQYLEIKKQYPDAILFFRLGDFYEMFFDDARLASRELEITLTGREGGAKERVPMCGIPYHACDTYIARLIAKKYRVAICEQVEDPSAAKGIVRREVVKVITPGTVLDGQLLEAKVNNYLASIAPMEKGFSFAVTDITTGQFMVGSFSGERAEKALQEELSRLLPAEIIVPLAKIETLPKTINTRGISMVNGYKDMAFDPAGAARLLEEQFGPGVLKTMLSSEARFSIPAAGALLCFIKETQKRDLTHIREIEFYQPGKYLHLDGSTRRNLELTRCSQDATRKNTLLSILDYTVTAMGGRLIRNWIEQPLLDAEKIESRLTAVEELVNTTLFRYDLKSELKHIYDLERLAGKISFGSANARDLVALKKSLGYLPALKALLAGAKSDLLQKTGLAIDPLPEVRDLINIAIEDDPPISVRDGGIIKKGYNSEVDRLRQAGREAKTMLAGLEERERARSGIKSLKVGFNKVFGYYIEVTRSNLPQVPAEYQRKQTLANAERYITPELKEYEDLLLGAKERLTQLEYSLFLGIRDKLAADLGRIQHSAAAVARADAFYSLAEAAFAGSYTRPEVSKDGLLIIRDGRHPVLEKVLGPEQFVPNDCTMDNEKCRLVLITGPNMAGKSTYMRQVALIILMTQIGSYVPASLARIPLVDRIFTRIGASDDLAGGQSTFMVEMNECRSIVKGATRNSLVIMDEVGRGTSTYDGISIARALVEYIHLKIGAKTLFSTHYHELTDMDQIPGIANYNVAVQENGEDIVFLRKVTRGKSDRSYGIHVARLAGLPEKIIARATEILDTLESTRATPAEAAATGENGGFSEQGQKPEPDKSRGETLEAKVIEKLRDLDVLNLTPLEAINQLHLLRQALEK